MARLRIGTRGSALARAQAGQVCELLSRARPDVDVELVVVTVSGDGGRSPRTDKSRWVDRIEDALVRNDIDLAVHSAKDVPAELAGGLALLGAPAREDARDALCGAGSLDELPAGARVGTGSLRRMAQLLAVREDLRIVALAGNVDTRLRRLAEGDFDAIVLAGAGLVRLGRSDDIGAHLHIDEFVPAPGQGILALEGRADDERAADAAEAISDAGAVAALEAERELVRVLGASCHTPVGVHARMVGPDQLKVSAFVGLPDGSQWVRDAGGRAQDVATNLLRVGVRDLLDRAEAMAVG